MTLASAFLNLEHAASRLEDEYAHLAWAVAPGDGAAEPVPAVVSQWEALAVDLGDLARQVAAEARYGRLAVNGRPDLAGAHRALSGCQERYSQLWPTFCTEALGVDRRRALDALSRRRGPWADWATGVAAATDRCLPPLRDVGAALGQTWQELVERAWLGLIVQSPSAVRPIAATATAAPPDGDDGERPLVAESADPIEDAGGRGRSTTTRREDDAP